MEDLKIAYEIIDNNFVLKNGIGNYNGIESVNESLLDIDHIVRSKKERDFMKFSNKDVHTLVLTWQKYNDDTIATALFEHYLLLSKKIMYKYMWAYNSFQQGRDGIDNDLYSEMYIILNKCLHRFKMIEGGTFTAFFVSELRNHYIETARKTSFTIAKMPSSIFRDMRKKIINNEADNFNYLKKAFDTTSSKDGDQVELDLISSLEDTLGNKVQEKLEKQEAIEFVFNYILKKFSENDANMFFMYAGITKLYTQKRLSEIFEISPSAVGKKINNIKKYLSMSPAVYEALNSVI
ncbi:MAG: hypothetical protein ACRCZ9_05755 [Fusobacteriaceae bacterium]